MPNAAGNSYLDGINPRSRKLFPTTDTLDKLIAALAISGDNIQPVSG